MSYIDKIEENTKKKTIGKVYTPDFLVLNILDQANYNGKKILKKHIIDNSSGNGQFLIHIVNRYCIEFLKISNDLKTLKKELETYIHAIEIDEKELIESKKRCEKVANKYNIFNIDWDFLNDNTLQNTNYIGKMDYVVGNPPYVRIHNLDNFDLLKKFSLSNNGMTDLYITFYEIGLNMLNNKGILCYITPSSFFTSNAGLMLRKYLVENKLIESICDLQHFKPFNASTYTTILCLNKKHFSNEIDYYLFDSENLKQKFIEKLNICDYFISSNFYFSTKNNLNSLKKINNNTKTVDVEVKNGFATLADNVFINDFLFESKYIIPVLKASTSNFYKIFYPYDESANIISEEELKKEKVLYTYLINNKTKLLERAIEKKIQNYWYAFGRSQAIKDTFKKKIAINTVIKDLKDIKINQLNEGIGVYSGLYILSETIEFERIKNALLDNEFILYISLLGKYKSGGYYTFSTKDLKNYLNYKLSSMELKNE